MSDELAGLVRGVVDAEIAAVTAEVPFPPTRVARYVADVRRRRVVGTSLVAAASLVVVGGAALGVARPWAAPAPVGEVTSSPAPSEDPTPEPTPTATTAPMPTATPAPVGTPSPTQTPTHEPEPEVTTEPPVLSEPPGAVTVTYVVPGGGSGEILVGWSLVPDATGYRVYRSDSPDGPFVAAARYDVASGEATVEYTGTYEYIGIHSTDQGLQYVEAVRGQLGYFQVVAYNDDGEGPPSAVLCGEPMAQGYTCA